MARPKSPANRLPFRLPFGGVHCRSFIYPDSSALGLSHENAGRPNEIAKGDRPSTHPRNFEPKHRGEPDPNTRRGTRIDRKGFRPQNSQRLKHHTFWVFVVVVASRVAYGIPRGKLLPPRGFFCFQEIPFPNGGIPSRGKSFQKISQTSLDTISPVR